MESKCLRISLIIHAVLILLFGGAVFGLSLWPLVDFWINEYVKSSEEFEKYRTACYIFVSGGAFLVVYSIFGIYGAAKPRRKCSLITYIACLSVSILLIVGGAIWCYIYRVEIKTEIQNSQLLTEILRRDYGKDLSVTRAYDFMQVELECCGGVGFEDYKSSDWINALKFQDNSQDVQTENAVPPTCCRDYKRYQNTPNPEYQYCIMYIDAQSGGQRPTSVNPNLWRKGCGKAVVDLFIEYMGAAAGLGIGTLCWMLLGIVFSAVLIHKFRESPYVEKSFSERSGHEMRSRHSNSPYSSKASSYSNLYR